MYKMLLVEDEPIVRLALKSMVDWSRYGFSNVLECANGRKALEIIKETQDIDIVITDINMPVMNGIELIEETKKVNEEIQFLVLSAYSDYSLVRSAFKLGINDYILKTEMEPEKVLKMVLSVLGGRERSKKDNNLKLDKEDMLKNLISSDIKGKIISKEGLNLKYSNYIILFMMVDNFSSVEKRYEDNEINEFVVSVKNAISQVLQSVNNGEVLSINAKEYVIFLSFEEDSISRVEDIISKIRYALKNFINIEVTVGVSGINIDVRNIKVLYEEAKSNACLRFIYGKGKNIYPQDAQELNNIKKDKNSNISQEIVLEMSRDEGLLQALDRLDEEKCLEEMKKIFKVKELFPVHSIEKIYIYYLEIALMIIQYIVRDSENNIENILGKHMDIYSEIKKLDTIEEIEAWLLKFLNEVLSALRIMRQKENYAIKKAKDFILLNYREKLTLEMVSKSIGFSKAYFSKIFSEETGDNFSTYLTNVRIDKAKELLDKTDMKIYEICDSVGYPSIEHFSRTFKKIVGVSPLQYKNAEIIEKH